MIELPRTVGKLDDIPVIQFETSIIILPTHVIDFLSESYVCKWEWVDMIAEMESEYRKKYT